MRTRETRVVESISAWLGRARAMPEPRALAEVVGAATGAGGCAVTVAGERYGWGEGAGPWLDEVVWYAGEPQGLLAVTPESAGPLRKVAAVLGAPLAAARLAAEIDRLRREGDAAGRELVDDRWRAVVEMEQERRLLERDLHDGAQHHLVALRMSLALVEHACAEGVVHEKVTDLLTRLDTAERVLTDTAAGMVPVVLACDGLGAALTSELAGGDVVLDTSGLRRRYPAVVESAVYYLCLEAVNNAHKHAPGARITLTVADSYRGLEFVVADTGPGFATTPGSNYGLRKLSERAAAVGGDVEVRSDPGRGTSVTGFVRL